MGSLWTEKFGSSWELFYSLSVRSRVLLVAALALLFGGLAGSMWWNSHEFEQRAQAAFLPTCQGDQEATDCEQRVSQNHEACFDVAFHSGGRGAGAYVDQGEYDFCVMHGHAAWVQRRQMERDARRAQEERLRKARQRGS